VSKNNTKSTLFRKAPKKGERSQSKNARLLEKTPKSKYKPNLEGKSRGMGTV
jgi:hypothetical protein